MNANAQESVESLNAHKSPKPSHIQQSVQSLHFQNMQNPLSLAQVKKSPNSSSNFNKTLGAQKRLICMKRIASNSTALFQQSKIQKFQKAESKLTADSSSDYTPQSSTSHLGSEKNKIRISKVNKNDSINSIKHQTTKNSFATTYRGSCCSNSRGESGSMRQENENKNKIQNYITENNIKRLEKFKTIHTGTTVSTHRGNTNTQHSQSRSQLRVTDKTPEQALKHSRTLVMNKEKSNERQSQKRLFDKHKRVLDKYSSRNMLKHGQASSSRLSDLDDNTDLLSPDQFKTIDTVTIENSKKQQFEVTINVPCDSSLKNRMLFSNYTSRDQQSSSGTSSIIGRSSHRQQNKFVQNKPPKPMGDQGLQQRRKNTSNLSNNYNFETQSIISDTLSQTNMSKMSSSTQLKPFNLSRSNSRRTKDVLLQQKQELESKKQEEIQKAIQEIQNKPKELPKNHFIPNLVVFKSTKSLTHFKEFNFNNTSRKSTNAVSSKGDHTFESQEQENKKHSYSILFKTQRQSENQAQEQAFNIQDMFSKYNTDKQNIELNSLLKDESQGGGLSILDLIIKNNQNHQ